jgi:hypothetical protein
MQAIYCSETDMDERERALHVATGFDNDMQQLGRCVWNAWRGDRTRERERERERERGVSPNAPCLRFGGVTTAAPERPSSTFGGARLLAGRKPWESQLDSPGGSRGGAATVYFCAFRKRRVTESSKFKVQNQKVGR